jgi:hypothetical protein
MAGEFSPIGFRWELSNIDDFQRALDRYAKVASDFRPAFIAISSDWYRSNRKLFTLTSSGLYQDLAPTTGFPTTTSNYKEQKQKKLGFVYPILVGESRKLSNSILGKNNFGSVYNIGRKDLIMGSSVEYGKFHQSDDVRRVLPQRKFVFIDGGPADKSKDSSINGRRERWLNIINDQIIQEITGEVLI